MTQSARGAPALVQANMGGLRATAEDREGSYRRTAGRGARVRQHAELQAEHVKESARPVWSSTSNTISSESSGTSSLARAHAPRLAPPSAPLLVCGVLRCLCVDIQVPAGYRVCPTDVHVFTAIELSADSPPQLQCTLIPLCSPSVDSPRARARLPASSTLSPLSCRSAFRFMLSHSGGPPAPRPRPNIAGLLPYTPHMPWHTVAQPTVLILGTFLSMISYDSGVLTVPRR